MLDPYSTYLTKRVAAYADLSGRRLLREIMKLGHEGSYLALKQFLHEVSPPVCTQFKPWFETPPGQQAQKDLCTIQDFLTVVNFVFFRRSE